MASQFTAGEHLKGSGTPSVDPRKSQYSRHEFVVNPTIKPCGLGSTADVLVEAQSPDAVVAQFCALARICVCFLVLFSVSSCTCHMH